MRVFLDANVLFTAAYSPGGKAAFLLSLGGDQLKFITSDYAILEARRNLEIKKPAAVVGLDSLLREIEIVPSVQKYPCPIALPEKDQPIFMSALKARATHLLTGDKRDFGPLMNRSAETSGVTIQTVSDFISKI